jgi:NitT/TauT family transport system permease protein
MSCKFPIMYSYFALNTWLRSMPFTGIKKFLFRAIAMTLLLILWEYSCSNSIKVKLLISCPSLIFKYVQVNYYNIIVATYTTFLESVVGLLLAILLSLSTMTICFVYPRLLRLVLPAFVTIQVVPLIALAPLLIMLLGIGYMSKIVMVVLISFFPLFMNFKDGFQRISKSVHELLFIYSASLAFRIARIYFPLSMPYIFTGLKTSATLSVIGAIVAEFNGADYGLGRNLFLAAKRLDPELMMVSLILTTTMGGFLYFIMWRAEHIFGYWYVNKGECNL